MEAVREAVFDALPDVAIDAFFYAVLSVMLYVAPQILKLEEGT